MTNYNGGLKLVTRLTMHDLKAVQDAFMVSTNGSTYIIMWQLKN